MNTFLLVVIFIWAASGLATVFFSAAIKGVPDALIDAARVDGATKRQVFYKVTLPYISATVVAVATITAIGALKVFDIVAATTGGNFGTSTIANEFYRVYFVQGRNGFGSAFAVLLFVLVIPVVVINRRAQRPRPERAGHEQVFEPERTSSWRGSSPSRSRPPPSGPGRCRTTRRSTRRWAANRSGGR